MEYEDFGIEPMDTSDTPWYWFYQAECGIWHRIEDDPISSLTSSELERYYLKNPQGVLDITAAGVRFQINFSVKVSLVCNRCKCADQAPSVPAHWENMDPEKPYQAFCLNQDTNEFKKVEKYIQEMGLLHKPIKNIYRIQNVDLWELYCRKRAQLKKLKGQPDIEEQMLFHGTSRDNVHSICLYNFDCNLSDQKRRAHILGKGTYFAKHASYAANYSLIAKPGVNTLQIMFLARVTVGKYKQGQSDLCKPDGDQKENIHDSCVDNEMYPRIFVIFDSNQIYPEYLLEYGC
uniref:Poly [ADP-ribose] polymerase n=1 Tax=Pygocentrus nattereri TaxID=42514 RepID=A0A3B4DG11_PYGNA